MEGDFTQEELVYLFVKHNKWHILAITELRTGYETKNTNI
jgi:hypothetical protein